MVDPLWFEPVVGQACRSKLQKLKLSPQVQLPLAITRGCFPTI